MVSHISQNDPKTTPKATPNDPHEIRLFLRTVPFSRVPLIFWDVCCLQVGFMLVMLVLCLLTLSLCWLMLDQVGSRWFMLVEVGPSGPPDASMLAQACLKMPKMAFQGLHNVKGQTSSTLEPKVFVLEHPQAFEKLK